MYAFDFVSGKDISDSHNSNMNLSIILCHINAFFIIQVIFTTFYTFNNKTYTHKTTYSY